MEILILQYSLAVLICLWWLKPFKKISFGKYKISSFNLFCALTLLFIALYALVRESNAKSSILQPYSILFLCMNMLLFLLVPAGYLYVRSQFYQRPVVLRKDIIHLLPCLLCFAVYVLPVFIYQGTNKPLSGDNMRMMLVTVFSYCALGVYIILIMRFLLDKQLAPLAAASRKKNTAILDKKNDKIRQTLSEVQVGSIHLDAAQLAKMDATLREFFISHEPFLKHGYNLKQLSTDTAIPLHHLSAFINQYYHLHFNDFVNERRIHYCQEKIKNDEWRFKTLEAIAEESGFSNRNTFTAAFKKVTGSNPSEYLKILKQKRTA
jgi:AraC-like DNA-binding protein